MTTILKNEIGRLSAGRWAAYVKLTERLTGRECDSSYEVRGDAIGEDCLATCYTEPVCASSD